MATVVYEDHGVRVECPSTWEIEVSEDGDEATISLQDPGGLAFGLVTTDDSCPDPDDVAAAALAAMREEYPELDVEPVFDTHGEHAVTGFDVEFFALDSANAARIRCFSTPRRTVLLFGQWSELGDSDLGETVAAVLGSVQELED